MTLILNMRNKMLKKNILIHETQSVKDAFKKLDKTAEKVLLVVDNTNKLIGTISDGDIRRHLLRGEKLENSIQDVYNKKPKYLIKGDFSLDIVRQIFLKEGIGVIPIINSAHEVVDFITWAEAFSDKKEEQMSQNKLDIPVIIMAGGKGTRLDPFSRIFPKPLIPIGDKPIIEIVIDEFRKQGIDKYYLTINYKGEMIESYFNHIQKDYQIEYIRENIFLGTAGSLKLLEKKINNVFIVSNCDVLVKADFREVVEIHQKQNASLTILSSIQYYKLPYGIVEFKEGGKVIRILEKPEYTFPINTGVYILSKESLRFIPKNISFDMTDLIEILIKNKQKVITYPVNENDYIDIGQWEEFKKSVEKLQLLK